jgi:hypothetical protein
MSYYELLARFELDLDASALNLIRREWGYMLRNGPGTFWEDIGPYGSRPTDMRAPSYDHGWSSGAGPVLVEYVLGVQPTSPGFATFTVTPHSGDLTFASGVVPTPHGPIKVAWKFVNSKLALTVDAPPGTTWTNRPAAQPKPAPKRAAPQRARHRRRHSGVAVWRSPARIATGSLFAGGDNGQTQAGS